MLTHFLDLPNVWRQKVWEMILFNETFQILFRNTTCQSGTKRYASIFLAQSPSVTCLMMTWVFYSQLSHIFSRKGILSWYGNQHVSTEISQHTMGTSLTKPTDNLIVISTNQLLTIFTFITIILLLYLCCQTSSKCHDKLYQLHTSYAIKTTAYIAFSIDNKITCKSYTEMSQK